MKAEVSVKFRDMSDEKKKKILLERSWGYSMNCDGLADIYKIDLIIPN